jgi:hypothetical protein
MGFIMAEIENFNKFMLTNSINMFPLTTRNESVEVDMW